LSRQGSAEDSPLCSTMPPVWRGWFPFYVRNSAQYISNDDVTIMPHPERYWDPVYPRFSLQTFLWREQHDDWRRAGGNALELEASQPASYVEQSDPWDRGISNVADGRRTDFDWNK
jgi:hypothetical protein